MSTETTTSPLVSHPPGSVPGWLTANRLKRGAQLYWAALFTLSAAVIHFIAGVAEPQESGLLVAFLIGFAVVQAVIAIVVVVFPARSLLGIAAIVEGVALLLWIGAHSTGFPLGGSVWRPETLGATD